MVNSQTTKKEDWFALLQWICEMSLELVPIHIRDILQRLQNELGI